MNGAVSAFIEQRDDPRVPTQALAHFDAPHGVFAQAGAAMIEDFGSCGLRLRAEHQLHPDQELVVKIPGDAFRLHARVVWVKEAPPFHRGGHKTWVAGCRLDPGSIGRVHLGPAIVDVRKPFPWRRVLQILGALGAVALVVYLFLRFATLVGGG